MKRLISAITVNEARKAGKSKIVIGGRSTIITDEARDLAKKYGIKFVDSVSASPKVVPEIDQATIKLIIEKTLEKLPAEKRDMSVVSEAVMKILKNYI